MGDLGFVFGKKVKSGKVISIGWTIPTEENPRNYYWKKLRSTPDRIYTANDIMRYEELWSTLCSINPAAEDRGGRGFYPVSRIIDAIRNTSNKSGEESHQWMLFWAEKTLSEYGEDAMLQIG